MGALGVWGRNLRLWVPSLVFFLITLGLLVFYRAVLADDAELGQARLARRAQELAAVRAERDRLAAYYEDASGLGQGTEHFFGIRLASEAASLTRLIAEIKDLSEKAGLAPQQITYDKESVEGEDILRRALIFPVEGTYQQLRQLINFLEISDSFIILEQISLRGDEHAAILRIDLQISTLFLAGPEGEVAIVAGGGEGAPSP